MSEDIISWWSAIPSIIWVCLATQVRRNRLRPPRGIELMILWIEVDSLRKPLSGDVDLKFP